MAQIEHAALLAEVKYPQEEGYKLVWIFDHSSCHGAYAEDALNANNMNANPGGKQPALHNTIWRGKEYSMVFSIGAIITISAMWLLPRKDMPTSRQLGPSCT